jgi:hypothetical protein
MWSYLIAVGRYLALSFCLAIDQESYKNKNHESGQSEVNDLESFEELVSTAVRQQLVM